MGVSTLSSYSAREDTDQQTLLRGRTKILPIQPHNFPAELILKHLGLKSLRAKGRSVSLFEDFLWYVARRERVDFRWSRPTRVQNLIFELAI